MLSPGLCFSGDKQTVLGEDKLADLISMDHYLTVRHFTVAEEWKPLRYIRMLGLALPSALNAIYDFEKGLACRVFFLSSQGTFLFPPAFVMQWAPQHSFTQIRNISPGHREMGQSLGPGESMASWFMNSVPYPVFPAGPFEAQLGTFSQGMCGAWEGRALPLPLSHLPLMSKFCWNGANLSFSSNLQGVCWLCSRHPSSLPA